MANITRITPPRVPLVDTRTGLISREWYRFFFNLYELTGAGANDITLADLQITTAAPTLGTLASENADNVRMLKFANLPSPAVVGTPGTLAWNDTDGTLDISLKGGNVTLQVGQEQVTLVKDADNAGIVEGAAYYFVGSDGSNKTVRKAQANSAATSDTVLGLATESSTGGNKAYLTTFGLVRGLDTDALTEGAPVYLSATVAGGLTATRPTAPNSAVQIGYCVRKSKTVGSIFVLVDLGNHLSYLHDVKITSVANGDTLKYDSANAYWKNVALNASALSDYATGTYTPVVSAGTGTITSYTATGEYTKIGRLVTVTINVNITDNGTGASYLIVSLPGSYPASTANYQMGCGREEAATGDILQVKAAGADLHIVDYDGAYPGGSGYLIYATITYRV